MQAQAEARGDNSDSSSAGNSQLYAGQPMQFGELIEVSDQDEFLRQVSSFDKSEGQRKEHDVSISMAIRIAKALL
jgi:hypothetical protein